MAKYISGQERSEEQSCFDILVSSFLSNIMREGNVVSEDGDIIVMTDQSKAYMIDMIMTAVEGHLDEEGLELLDNAYAKYEYEYNVQVDTENILNSFEWNKDKEEEEKE